MNIYDTFNNLRYHHEDEVVEFLQTKRLSRAQEGGEQLQLRRHWLFVSDGLTNGSFKLINRYIIFL